MKNEKVEGNEKLPLNPLTGKEVTMLGLEREPGFQFALKKANGRIGLLYAELLLTHYSHLIKELDKQGVIQSDEPNHEKLKMMLVAGVDLITSMIYRLENQEP